eukprot:CFRG2306T1
MAGEDIPAESMAVLIRKRHAVLCKDIKEKRNENPSHVNRPVHAAGSRDTSTDGLLRLPHSESRSKERNKKSLLGFPQTENLELTISLLDGSATKYTFAGGKKTTAQDVVDTMATACGLSKEAKSACALWIHEQALELLLKPHFEPYKVRKQWPEIMFTFTRRPYDVPCIPRFEFRKNPFLTKTAETSIEDPAFIILLYTECRYNVISCLYPCSVKEAAQLAGLDVQLAFGDYNPNINPDIFYSEARVKECISRSLVGKLKISEWVELISKAHRHHAGRDPVLIHRLYLNLCRQWSHYGCTWFYGRVCNETKEVIAQDTPTELIRIGVNYDGIHLINHITNTIIVYVPLDQLAWYASELDKLLYIEYGDPKKPTPMSIITPQARIVETMILRFLAMAKLTQEPGPNARIGYNDAFPCQRRLMPNGGL